MGELTVFFASDSSFTVVVLAFFSQVEKLIRRSSVVKRFVGINAMVPIMILRLVCTEGSFISINVEYDGIYGLQVKFKSLLERVINAFNANFCEILAHFKDVKILVYQT